MMYGFDCVVNIENIRRANDTANLCILTLVCTSRMMPELPSR